MTCLIQLHHLHILSLIHDLLTLDTHVQFVLHYFNLVKLLIHKITIPVSLVHLYIQIHILSGL